VKRLARPLNKGAGETARRASSPTHLNRGVTRTTATLLELLDSRKLGLAGVGVGGEETAKEAGFGFGGL
jgi:hypothetical protein